MSSKRIQEKIGYNNRDHAYKAEVMINKHQVITYILVYVMNSTTVSAYATMSLLFEMESQMSATMFQIYTIKLFQVILNHLKCTFKFNI